MKLKLLILNCLHILLPPLFFTGCKNEEKGKQVLLQTINDYENACASGDFLRIEMFFADRAKRLLTEPYVWDRNEIRRYFQERAKQIPDSSLTFVKNARKKESNNPGNPIEGTLPTIFLQPKNLKRVYLGQTKRCFLENLMRQVHVELPM